MSARAIFLDRDGTIMDDVGYASSLDQLIPYPYAAQALHELKAAGFLIILVSNQAGVGRGLIDSSFPEVALRHLRESLRWNGGSLIDGGYHCPHHPEAKLDEYRIACRCRKPAPGMLHQAARDFGVALPLSYVVGDHLSDIEAAHRVCAAGVLLLSGHGQQEAAKIDRAAPFARPDHVAENLLEAARWILQREDTRPTP